MKLIEENIIRQCEEKEIIESLELNDKQILELGCGSAVFTRDIAKNGKNRNITAMEVDKIQHNKNLLINDLPNVKFVLCGAQAIKAEDESFDVVFMFKSLHHVPLEQMKKVLEEIYRVLKPKGFVYISEPLFHGSFNELMRIFHDEQKVRLEAFNTIKKFVDNKYFSLFKEVFFNDSVTFDNFEAFEKKLIKATYANHTLDDKLYEKIKKQFLLQSKNHGTKFLKPIRVDILQKN